MGSSICCITNNVVKSEIPIEHHGSFKRQVLPVISFEDSKIQINIIKPNLSQSFESSFRSKSSNSNISSPRNSSFEDSIKTHESDNEFEQVIIKSKKTQKFKYKSTVNIELLNSHENIKQRRASAFLLPFQTKTKQPKKQFQMKTKPNSYNNNNNNKQNCEIKLIENKVNLIKKDEDIRTLIIGVNQSGKSSFVYKAIKGKFSKVYIPRIGVENEGRIFSECGTERTIRFYVLPSENEFDSIYKHYYENTHLVLVFYDISVKGSFEQAISIFNQYKENIQGLIIEGDVNNFMFVGNKTDCIERQEPFEVVKNMCNENKYEFNEISVKTGKGLKCLMNAIINKFECIKDLNQDS